MSAESPKASKAIQELCSKLEHKGIDTKAIADAIGADHGTLKSWLRGSPMGQAERFLNLLSLCEKTQIPWQHLVGKGAPIKTATPPIVKSPTPAPQYPRTTSTPPREAAPTHKPTRSFF